MENISNCLIEHMEAKEVMINWHKESSGEIDISLSWLWQLFHMYIHMSKFMKFCTLSVVSYTPIVLQ